MPSLNRFKPGSIGQYFEGPQWDGKCVEVYSSVCAHCQHPTEFLSMKKMRDYVDICRGCMRLICEKCAAGPCRPFEQEAERQEREARLQARVEAQGWRCY